MVPQKALRDYLYRFVGHPGGRERGLAEEELHGLRAGLLPSIEPYLVRALPPFPSAPHLPRWGGGALGAYVSEASHVTWLIQWQCVLMKTRTRPE
jgi:hypothetical protein